MSKKPHHSKGKTGPPVAEVVPGVEAKGQGKGHIRQQPKPKTKDGKTVTVMTKSGTRRRVTLSKNTGGKNVTNKVSPSLPSLPLPSTDKKDKSKHPHKPHKKDEVKEETPSQTHPHHPHKENELKKKTQLKTHHPHPHKKDEGKEETPSKTHPHHPHHHPKKNKNLVKDVPPSSSTDMFELYEVVPKHRKKGLVKRHHKSQKPDESDVSLSSTTESVSESDNKLQFSKDLLETVPKIPPDSQQPEVTSKRKRKKVQKGTYKKFYDPGALDPELEDTGSSVSESLSSEDYDGEEDDPHPDMNWILNDNETGPQVKDEERKNNNAKAKIKTVLDPYLWTCFGLGRLPFKFRVDPKTGVQICTMPRISLSFIVFVLTSLVMLVALLQIGKSAMSLFSSDVKNAGENAAYLRLELLLFHNWWLPISIFIFSLFMVVVGSLSVIISGPSMADYITLWMSTLTHFDTVGYTIHTKSLRFIAWCHPISTGLNLAIILALCGTKLFSFQQPIQIITILLFRDYKNLLYFKLMKETKFLYFLVAIFMAYVCFSARSFLVLIIIFCRGIVHLAEQWNTRLAIILRKLTPGQARMQKMKPQKYEDMLSDHQKLVVLVSGVAAFSTILVMYSLVEFFKLIASLFATCQDLAISTNEINATHVEHTDNVRYELEIQDEWFGIAYHLIHTIMSFGFVSWGATAAGDMVMTGFDSVRRHGLLLAKGVKERKFIMSLTMSFNAASPHVICPSNWFLFDRGFIMSGFCGAMAVYCLLIQLTIVHKVDVAIVFPCEPGKPKLCLGSKVLNLGHKPQAKDIEGMMDDNSKNVNEAVRALPTIPPTLATLNPTNPPNPVPAPPDGEDFNPGPVTEQDFEERCIRRCPGRRSPKNRTIQGSCILEPYAHISPTETYTCAKFNAPAASVQENCDNPAKPDKNSENATTTDVILECFEEKICKLPIPPNLKPGLICCNFYLTVFQAQKCLQFSNSLEKG